MNINKILTDAGLKCTAQRIQIIEILNKTDAPMTAENIYESSNGISLSTVYRVTEKLAERGIVTKNTIRDSDKFYYELADNKHRHYAICLSCGAMKYVDICPIHDLQIDDFTVTGHKLEIYGYCANCKSLI